MLSQARNVLSMGSTNSVPYLPSVGKLIKVFTFMKRASINSLDFRSLLLKCLNTFVRPQHVHFMQ